MEWLIYTNSLGFPFSQKHGTTQKDIRFQQRFQFYGFKLQELLYMVYRFNYWSNILLRRSIVVAQLYFVGLVEMLWQRVDFQSLVSALQLCKCFKAKLWEDSKHVSKQLDGIGRIYYFYSQCFCLRLFLGVLFDLLSGVVMKSTIIKPNPNVELLACKMEMGYYSMFQWI